MPSISCLSLLLFAFSAQRRSLPMLCLFMSYLCYAVSHLLMAFHLCSLPHHLNSDQRLFLSVHAMLRLAISQQHVAQLLNAVASLGIALPRNADSSLSSSLPFRALLIQIMSNPLFAMSVQFKSSPLLSTPCQFKSSPLLSDPSPITAMSRRLGSVQCVSLPPVQCLCQTAPLLSSPHHGLSLRSFSFPCHYLSFDLIAPPFQISAYPICAIAINIIASTNLINS